MWVSCWDWSQGSQYLVCGCEEAAVEAALMERPASWPAGGPFAQQSTGALDFHSSSLSNNCLHLALHIDTLLFIFARVICTSNTEVWYKHKEMFFKSFYFLSRLFFFMVILQAQTYLIVLKRPCSFSFQIIFFLSGKYLFLFSPCKSSNTYKTRNYYCEARCAKYPGSTIILWTGNFISYKTPYTFSLI